MKSTAKARCRVNALLLACALAFGLSACQRSAPEPAPADIARAESLRPPSAALAERYERSCMTCHARHGSGAPLTGFAPHWQARLQKGKEQLQQHALQGFNAMPAKGSCNDCTEQEISALTQFMAGL
jgi:cytochrome c5